MAVSGDTVVVGATGTTTRASFRLGLRVRQAGGRLGDDQHADRQTDRGGRRRGDNFGRSVAVSGDTVVVGAYGDDGKGNNRLGLRVRQAGGRLGDDQLTHTAKLTAADGAAYDYFGCSVAVSGDTVVVGAYGDDDKGSDSGSAYVFEHCTGSAGAGLGAGTTWGSGAVPTSTDGVCVLNGHTVTLGAAGQSRFIYVEKGGVLDLATFSVTAEESVQNYGAIQQTQNVGAASTVNFVQIRNSGNTTDKYRGLDITTGGVDLGSATVRIMGNTRSATTTMAAPTATAASGPTRPTAAAPPSRSTPPPAKMTLPRPKTCIGTMPRSRVGRATRHRGRHLGLMHGTSVTLETGNN